MARRKTASIMTLIEQMVETRGWKVARGLMKNGRCRLCGEFIETVEHLVAGCKKVAKMVMAIAWLKEYWLVGKKHSGIWKTG